MSLPWRSPRFVSTARTTARRPRGPRCRTSHRPLPGYQPSAVRNHGPGREVVTFLALVFAASIGVAVGLPRSAAAPLVSAFIPLAVLALLTPFGGRSVCRAICVSKRTNSLVWVVDGQARLRMDVRFGSDRTPTREGSFRVGWKSRHHFSSLYDTSMPYAMFFSGGQAVHYSPDFAARGYNGASHGCVNIRNLGGIQALFASARVGDKIIVHR